MAETHRILYVDDEPGLLEIARLFLEVTGDFSVVTVESATGAIDLLKTDQFDAIISDYQMPVMDGIELLKAVRASGNTIPFIIFTGKGREEIVIQALNEGADFYIQKGGEPESQFIELGHIVKVAVEQSTAKERFQKSEERFRLIFDSSTDSLYSYDRSGRFTSVNRNLCNNMGLAPDQMIGKTHEELAFPAEQCKEWDKLHQQVYTTNASVITDTSTPMPDGKLHQYNVILNPIHDNRGTIIGISGITQDITELKRAELDLRTSEELLSAMFNGITESALIMSPEGTILAANETIAKRLGQKHGSDLIGKNAITLLPRDIQETRQKKVDEVLKSGQPVHFEDIRNDRIIDQTIYPVCGPDGTVNRLAIFGIDITERKKAEEQLKLSEWRQRLALQIGQIGTFEVDIESGTGIWSEELARIWGIPDNFTGSFVEYCWDHTHPDDLLHVREEFAAAVESHKITDMEFRIITPKGEVRWISWKGDVKSDCRTGKKLAAGVNMDITERKRSEEAIQKKNEELNAAYEQLAGSEEELRQNYKELESSQRALQESEETFRTVADFTYNWEYWISPSGKIIYTSPSCKKISGYSVQELTADPTLLEQMIHEDDRPVYNIHYSLITSEKDSIYQADFRIRTKDGQERWIGHVCNPVYDKEGTYRGRRACNREITDRKRGEEELILKDFAIDSSINAIAITDLQGNLTYVNPAFLSIMGYEDLQEVLNKSVISFWTSPDGAQIFEGIQKKGHWSGKITGQRKDDTPIHAQVLINLIHDASGKPVAMMGSFVDITERIRAEESLLKINQKLHVLSQLTREDLNNKILALNSYLDLTKIQLKRQESVTGTLQKLEGGFEQISRINEYTKDYQDMGVKPPKWQNLKTVMLMGLSHIPLGNFQHSLETGNLEIFADPLMEKVCQHFFENSVMHGEHVTRVRVWHTISPGEVTIFFEDDGIGIPQVRKEKIFLRDLSNRSSRHSLIFAREILDITGISIKETGEPGKGIRFEMNVPEGAYRFGV